MNKYLSLDYLKTNYTKIHAFGLGFIQIKLGDIERLHVYTKEVDLTTQPEEIHNHRYDFKSTVFKGLLTNKIYHLQESNSGEYSLIDEACNPLMAKSEKQISVLKPLLVTEFNTGAGQSYFIDKDTFHQVEAQEGTITLVQRGPVIKTHAQVVFPKEQKIICPFSVNLAEDQLWEIVREKL